MLFIDARKLGMMVDRVHRELTEDDIRKIADTYHTWRRVKDYKQKYGDIAGFCKRATFDEIRKHNYVLTPGRYVGVKVKEEEGERFAEKMQRLVATLREQQVEARRLDEVIARNLAGLGYGM